MVLTYLHFRILKFPLNSWLSRPRNVTSQVDQGKLVAVVGPHGSGKKKPDQMIQKLLGGVGKRECHQWSFQDPVPYNWVNYNDLTATSLE